MSENIVTKISELILELRRAKTQKVWGSERNTLYPVKTESSTLVLAVEDGNMTVKTLKVKQWTLGNDVDISSRPC